MKRAFLLFIGLLLTMISIGQTQKGYVKTRGRLDSNGKLIPGKGLKGATVSIKGRTAVLVKSDDGAFSFPIPDKQFRIDSVRKKGYQLVDMDFCGKPRDYSDTPIDILMEIPGQSYDDYMEDFDRINASQQKMIGQLRAEVKQLKNQNKINENEYKRRLSEIANMQSESQKLVEEMAERYSKMDFDRVDDFEKQLSWLILNGELIKADSLINSQGSMEELSAELDSIHNANEKEKAELDERTETWEKSKKYEAKRLESFASKCYSKHEICKLRHVYDSATYWLELRASKDTTNVEWQIDAGFFIDKYIADYNKALSYYQLGLRQALTQYGEQNYWIALLYNNIGSVLSNQGEYEKSLGYYDKAHRILRIIIGEDDPITATSFNNLGVVYSKLGEYNKALEYFNKALTIRILILGEDHPDVASSYNNIGTIYYDQGKYSKAKEYYHKALNIKLSAFGENHLDVAACYDNIGAVILNQGDFNTALSYFNKALTIKISALGESHPVVADSYNNIGAVFDKSGNYNDAIDCFRKSLDLRLSIFGKYHPSVATSYGNLGSVYFEKQEYENAILYDSIALTIQKTVYGESHPIVAKTYGNIGAILHRQGNYGKALEQFYKALNILESFFDKMHPKVVELNDCILVTNYEQAIENNTIQSYNESHCFTATIIEEESPASQQGMFGEYILLEFADWNQNSPSSLFDKSEELSGKPKDILVIKNNTIEQHHFENTIGAELSIKLVDKEEKQRINKAYDEWKKQNRQQP